MIILVSCESVAVVCDLGMRSSTDADSSVGTLMAVCVVQHTTGNASGGGYETHQHHHDSFATKSYVQGS